MEDLHFKKIPIKSLNSSPKSKLKTGMDKETNSHNSNKKVNQEKKGKEQIIKRKQNKNVNEGIHEALCDDLLDDI